MPLTKITRGALTADIIDSTKLADNAVDTEHLATDAVTNAKIEDNAVDTEHLADDAVGADELASDAVVNASVASDAAIADSKLATDPATKANLASPTFTGTPVTPIIKLTPAATASAPTGSEGSLYYDSDKDALMVYGTSWQKVAKATATGGTIDTSVSGYKIHIFTSDGTFTVSGGTLLVWYLVLAGGGGGGAGEGGGGGAGGFLTNDAYDFSVGSASYTIQVGEGGRGGDDNTSTRSANGEDSIFSSITATGGGAGDHTPTGSGVALVGGSGGGGGAGGDGASGTAGQGNAGGDSLGSPTYEGGGGGGAGGAGGTGSGNTAGNGGIGVNNSITGASVSYAGGGGGGIISWNNGTPGNPVSGYGGGQGQDNSAGGAGTDGKGGGGGGGGNAGSPSDGGAGGDGIVIIRYAVQEKNMAYFARLDKNNIVKSVHIVDDNHLLNEHGVAEEDFGIVYLNKVHGVGFTWVQTSKDGSIRKNRAGIGDTYDKERDAFIPFKTFPSWTLNEETCKWESPVPFDPEENKPYRWNEDTTSWDEI